jgi:hypothetical protein
MLRYGIAAFLLSVLLAGCDVLGAIGLGGSSHPWMTPGTCRVYDFQNVGDPVIDPTFGHPYPDADTGLVLRVKQYSEGNPFLRGHYAAWSHPDTVTHISGIVGYNFAGLGDGGAAAGRSGRGIEVEYATTCGSSDLEPFDFGPKSTFVRVPASPRVGDTFPIRRCGDVTRGAFTVTATDRSIQVPAGTFDVFVMESPKLRQREYWSEAHGLIRADKLDAGGARLGTYRLRDRSCPGA